MLLGRAGYATYHRASYRDFGGYENRPPVLLSDAEYARMPPDLQARFTWTRDDYRTVRRKYWLRRVLPPALRLKLSKDI